MKIINKESKCNPLIFHFPGISTNPKKYKTWNYLSKKCLKSNLILETDSELTIITWNSRNNKEIVEKRLEKNNVPYIVLGENNKNWINSDKIKLTYDAIKKINTKYILAIDCYDVLFFGSPKEVLKRFKKLNCKMLFNAERNFWPDLQVNQTNTWKEYQSSINNYYTKYLNAGVWIGERHFCEDFFEKCLFGVTDLINSNQLPENLGKIKTTDSEQIVMHRIWFEKFKNSTQLTLDYNSQIFMNLANQEEMLEFPILF
jgi:hypothetical protein